jgi:polypeptide N-acetylgalactosaminyltransferase
MSEQLAVREKLKCKPFSWFMREVAWDLEKYYPTVEPPPFAAGEIRSVSSKLCIDTKNAGEQQTFGLNTCMKDKPGISGEQHFDFTWHKDIRPGPPPGRHMCFDVSTSHSHSPIVLYHCHGMQGNQLFKFNLATNQLFHPVSRQCVDHDADRKELFMNACDSRATSQRWSLQNMNRTALEKLWNEPLQ